MLRSPICISAMALLAVPGCGGGASDAGGGGSIAPIVRLAAFETTVSRLEELSLTADVPTGGEAEYRGYIGLTAAPEGEGSVYLTAEAELTARFAGGTIEGSFDRVVSTDDPGASGSGTIESGTIGLGGVSADIVGELRLHGQVYGVDAELSAGFVGEDAFGIVGTVAGDLRDATDRAGSIAGEAWLISD